MSEPARTYLTGVLDAMQKGALNRDSIDWDRVRAETLALAGDARTTTDTYVAIAHAIGELKERHSMLVLPDNLDKDRKQAIQAQMRLELSKTRGAVTGSSRAKSPFASPNEMAGHLDRRNGRVFAHVVVPHCSGQYAEWERNTPYFEEFERKLSGIVADLLSQKPGGWLIDLRGNGGGNMWPMLAGIAAVLGEGDLGSFQSPGAGASTWLLKDGKITQRAGGPGVGTVADSRLAPVELSSSLGGCAVGSGHREFGRGGGHIVCGPPTRTLVWGAHRWVLYRQSQCSAAGWSFAAAMHIGGGGPDGTPVSGRD